MTFIANAPHETSTSIEPTDGRLAFAAMLVNAAFWFGLALKLANHFPGAGQ
ncbi:MAG: hypothetical protein Q8R82_01640 [Hyphomonadaceae bacterium]|nr:hypothetical protein [Hyphomonadaceae bacterium]